MGANTAGIYGAQLFRSDDSPLYRRAFSINIAILAFGLVLAVVRYVDDVRRRRGGQPLGAIERAEWEQEDLNEERRIGKGDERSDEDVQVPVSAPPKL